jgi:hypothetical protein
MRVYITKYALTKGIYEVEGTVGEYAKGMVTVQKSENSYDYYHGEGVEWHRSYEDALKHAICLKNKRIAYLKKQIQKIERLFIEGEGS